MRFYTLGDTAIEVGGTRLGPTSVHTFAAALYLGVERDRRVSRATLQGLLYPKSSEANASHSLRQLVYKLKQLSVPLDADGESVMLPGRCIVDDYTTLVRAERLTTSELRALQGGFLPGYSPSFSSAYADWCDAFRTRVTLQLRRILVEQMSELRRRGEWRDLDLAARACLALDPLNEEGTLALAEALAMTGSKVEAVKRLDRYLTETSRAPNELRIPARILRNRISERLAHSSQRFADRQSSLVGRERERFNLLDCLRRAENGQSQVVIISGEAGIGKTRLAAEIANFATISGCQTSRVTLRDGDCERPLSAFTGQLRQLLTLPGALGCSPDSLSLLQILHDSEEGTGRSVRRGAIVEATLERIRGSVIDLIEALTAESPLLMTMDNGNDLDSSSTLLIRSILALPVRLLVILTARELGKPLLLLHSDGARSLPLSSISKDAGMRLLDEILDGHAVPGELKEWFLRTASGNPLFIRALAEHFREIGEPFSLPPSLVELLAARLNELGSEARAILESASALGEQSTASRIQQVLGMSRAELLDGLRKLERRGLIVLERDSIQPATNLLREVIAANTSPIISKLLNQTVKELTEPLIASADSKGELVLHQNRDADLHSTTNALRALSRDALLMGRPHEACELLERALELPLLPTVRKSILEEIVIAATQAEDPFLLADAFRALRRVSEDEYSITTPTTVAELEALYRSGHDPHPIKAEAIALLEGVMTAENRLRCASVLLALADQTCDAAAAEKAMEYIAGAAPQSTDEGRFLVLRSSLIYHTTFGNLDSAGAVADELEYTASRCNDVPLRCRALLTAALAQFRSGNVNDSRRLLEWSLNHSIVAGLHTLSLWALSQLSWHALHRGDLSEAREWSDRAEQTRERALHPLTFARHFANLAQLAASCGKFDEAELWLHRGIRDSGPALRSKSRLLFDALQFRARLASSRPIDGSHFAETYNYYLLARNYGIEDEATVAMYFVLGTTVAATDRHQLLREYVLRHRRMRYPLSAELQELVGKDRAMSEDAAIQS